MRLKLSVILVPFLRKHLVISVVCVCVVTWRRGQKVKRERLRDQVEWLSQTATVCQRDTSRDRQDHRESVVLKDQRYVSHRTIFSKRGFIRKMRIFVCPCVLKTERAKTSKLTWRLSTSNTGLNRHSPTSFEVKRSVEDLSHKNPRCKFL